MELPYIPFLTAENASMFWQFTRAILFIAMPFLLIYIATQYAGSLLSVIRKSFSGRSDSEKDYDIKTKD